MHCLLYYQTMISRISGKRRRYNLSTNVYFPSFLSPFRICLNVYGWGWWGLLATTRGSAEPETGSGIWSCWHRDESCDVWTPMKLCLKLFHGLFSTWANELPFLVGQFRMDSSNWCRCAKHSFEHGHFPLSKAEHYLLERLNLDCNPSFPTNELCSLGQIT